MRPTTSTRSATITRSRRAPCTPRRSTRTRCTGATGPLGDIGIAANSPAALTAHKAWNDPAGFHASCDVADLPPVGQPALLAAAGPPAPVLIPRAGDTGTTVQVDVPPDPNRPAATKVVVGLV